MVLVLINATLTFMNSVQAVSLIRQGETERAAFLSFAAGFCACATLATLLLALGF